MTSKKKNKLSGLADKTMQKKWRLAVLSAYGSQDPISGERRPEVLQCHHIIKRWHWLTRHDWRNGVPLDNGSHRRVHGVEGNTAIFDIISPEHKEYLLTMNRWMKPDYLLYSGMSEREYLLMQVRDLDRVIEEGVNRRDPDHYILPEWMT